MTAATTFASLIGRLVVSLLFVTVTMSAVEVGAQQTDSAGQVGFGIRPVTANPLEPMSFGFFVNSIEPGDEVAEQARVFNEGSDPVRLLIHVTDATTAINGGTAFGNGPESQTQAASWISLDVSELDLQPGETQIIEFAIDVPEDAEPGEYIAGLVVQAKPEDIENSEDVGTQFGVNVIYRVGVAVVIDVPGPRVTDLTVADLRIRDITDEGTLLSVGVENTGNVMVRGTGSFTLTGGAGDAIATLPITIDTVLPGDLGLFLVPFPEILPDGDYQLAASIDYQAVFGDPEQKSVAFGPITASIVDGVPSDASATNYPETQPVTPPTLASEDTSGETRLILYVSAAAALVLLVAGAALLWARRRTKRERTLITEPVPQADRTVRQARHVATGVAPEGLPRVEDPFAPNRLSPAEDEPEADDGNPWSTGFRSIRPGETSATRTIRS